METQRFKTLAIYVRNINSEEELINCLLTQFGFLDLYAHNWEGLEKHVFYDPMIMMPKELVIIGISSLEEKLPDETIKLKNWVEGASGLEFKYLK